MPRRKPAADHLFKKNVSLLLKTIAVLSIVLAVFAACEKEYSFERGPEDQWATGSLRSVSGDCQPAEVHGVYEQNNILEDSNYVFVQVHFTSPGRYHIFSDTQNGFSFSDSAVVTDTGYQSIKLKAAGIPVLAQKTSFLVRFDTSICTFSIDVPPTIVTGPATVNLADSAWEFHHENQFYHGYFDGASTETSNGSTTLTLVGLTATKDTAIAILVGINSSSIKTGTYTSTATASFLFFDRSGTNIYNADKTTAGVEVAVEITAYEAATKIVEGTFSGTALNKGNEKVPVSGGKFKAQLD